MQILKRKNDKKTNLKQKTSYFYLHFTYTYKHDFLESTSFKKNILKKMLYKFTKL